MLALSKQQQIIFGESEVFRNINYLHLICLGVQHLKGSKKKLKADLSIYPQNLIQSKENYNTTGRIRIHSSSDQLEHYLYQLTDNCDYWIFKTR